MIYLPPASKNLRRHGDSQTVLQIAFLGMSFAFWIVARLSDAPVMESRVYGDLVGSYPAELWAASIMLACGVYLAGIITNGNWRWSPALRVIGAGWHCVTLSLFAQGGLTAEFGAPMLIWGLTALGIHLTFLLWNVGDLARAVRHG